MTTIQQTVALFDTRFNALTKTGKEFFYEGNVEALSQFENIPDFVPGTAVAGRISAHHGMLYYILIMTKVGFALIVKEVNGEIMFCVDKQLVEQASWIEFGAGKAGPASDAIVERLFGIVDSYSNDVVIVEPEGPAAEAFNRVYYRAPQIHFNEKWANGTGYYDGAVDGGDAPVLAQGQIVRVLSPLPNDRRILIVGTALGNVVVFDRFSGGLNGVFVKNVSTKFSQSFVGNLIGSGSQNAEHIHFIFGNDPDNWNSINVGKWMKNLQADIVRYKEDVAKHYAN